jgi:hypothetical protein
MTRPFPDDTGLEPAEEACLRRVMSRLRLRLGSGDASGVRSPSEEPSASRQRASACGEIVIDSP